MLEGVIRTLCREQDVASGKMLEDDGKDFRKGDYGWTVEEAIILSISHLELIR